MSMNSDNRVETVCEDTDLPRYETPRIQVMSEKDILNSFQITQSMGGWWNIASC